jgi:hypothetical protein
MWSQHRKSFMKLASSFRSDDADWLEVDRDRHEDGDIPDKAIFEIFKISQLYDIPNSSQDVRRNTHLLFPGPALRFPLGKHGR